MPRKKKPRSSQAAAASSPAKSTSVESTAAKSTPVKSISAKSTSVSRPPFSRYWEASRRTGIVLTSLQLALKERVVPSVWSLDLVYDSKL